MYLGMTFMHISFVGGSLSLFGSVIHIFSNNDITFILFIVQVHPQLVLN